MSWSTTPMRFGLVTMFLPIALKEIFLPSDLVSVSYPFVAKKQMAIAMM